MGDDDLGLPVDRRLRVVALDIAVLGEQHAAVGIREVALRLGLGLVARRRGRPAVLLSALRLALVLDLGPRPRLFGGGSDGEAQIIVAHTLTSSMSDHGQLVPLLDGIQANLGRRPREASADSGYLSEANLASLEARVIKAYIATGRAKHPADVKRKIGGPLTQGMRRKLKRAGWRSRYRLRKQIVEPVFGQIKQARGFRQFLLRGIDAVAAEWAMICTAHNLTKLARAT